MELYQTPIQRKKLRQWIILEELRENIIKSFKGNNSKAFSGYIHRYIFLAYDLTDDTMLEDMGWWKISRAYEHAVQANRPILQIPMMVIEHKKEDYLNRSYACEYPERTWYIFANIFAKNYGWSLQAVADLDVDDAFALIQEITMDDQLEKEFYYSLSEIAYPYDANRKLNVYKPYPRPAWMREMVQIQAPKKVKIRKDMLPVGLIVGSSRDDTKH